MENNSETPAESDTVSKESESAPDKVSDHVVSESNSESTEGADTKSEPMDSATNLEEAATASKDETKPAGEPHARFPLMLSNLPKYIGVKQVQQLIKREKLPIPKKIIPQKEAALIEYRNADDRDLVCERLNGFLYKNKTLMSKIPPPRMQRMRQKAKEQVPDNRSEAELEEAMLDATAPLRSVPYEEQLQQKQSESVRNLEQLLRQLRVVSDADEHCTVVQPILPCPVQDAYRNKCEFTIGINSEKQKVVGFQVKGSPYIVNPRRNPIIPQLMKDIVDKFQSFLRSDESSVVNLPTYDSLTFSGYWRMLTLRCFSGGTLMILTVNPKGFPEETITLSKKQIVRFVSDNFEGVIKSVHFQRLINTSDPIVYEHLNGDETVIEKLSGLSFSVSPGSFFQTCSKAAEVCYNAIGDRAQLNSESIVADICCGTGTIAMSLASKAKTVFGVEIVKEAVECAKKNAELNNIQNCIFIAGKAEDTFAHFYNYLPFASKDSEVIGVLDPPRPGMHAKIIITIRRMDKIRQLIYVSCDPKQASRNFVDLCRRPSNKFPGKPFHLKEVTPIDMFPQTGHFEWLLVFER